MFHAPKSVKPGGMENVQKTYLCQVSEELSCGACCGLYNVPGLSREGLLGLLSERTEKFAKVPRTEKDIDDFGLGEKNRVNDRLRPCPEFHHCPFLGLVGENLSRVGCLLHPLGRGNHGVDHRGLSWYGAFACRTYFCPTHHEMNEEYKKIVIAASPGWYLYGLIITEKEMLENFFHAAGNRLGKPITFDFIMESPKRTRAVLEFLRLKESWPFRPAGSPRTCHYFFKDGLYPDTPIPYAELGAKASPFDPVLRALGSDFSSARELHRAEEMLCEIMGTVIS